MYYNFNLNGIQIKTGDIICTKDGDDTILPGQFWRLLGLLIEGDVDHIAIYIGPDGRFIESGPKGVIEFTIKSNIWDAEKFSLQREGIIDELYGVAFPLENKGYTVENENAIRESIANYCITQIGKPYNLNFLDSNSDNAFYCSQLAYKAYLPFGINFNIGLKIPELPGTENIVYPQEIWDSCNQIKNNFKT